MLPVGKDKGGILWGRAKEHTWSAAVDQRAGDVEGVVEESEQMAILS